MYYVPGNALISLHNGGPSLQDNGSSLQDNGPSLQDNGPSLQDNERVEIALRPLKKRLKSVVLEKIILDLCSIRGFERAEIARLLKRDETYVRTILTRLVKSCKLRMRYPEMPNHPRQTYYTFIGYSTIEEKTENKPQQ